MEWVAGIVGALVLAGVVDAEKVLRRRFDRRRAAEQQPFGR
jgi:hypothetical protein